VAAFLAAGVAAGLLYFPPRFEASLTWVSCSQDLLACPARWQRSRRGDGAAIWALVAYLLAVFSKESALPLPIDAGAA
jgi:hypothetical protein